MKVLMYPSLHRQVHFRFRETCCITNQKQQRCASLRRNSARDRVIEFGKYKGKMLGSLPSRYLKWVSKNLRAREFEEWAILADQVLEDPIYKDRVEWEFALSVLDGSARSTEPASSQLQEISERFGWDNLDKIGWSKVDFDLLGTSLGGRIPKLGNRSDADVSKPKPPPAKSISSNRSRRIERRREKLEMRLGTVHEAQQRKDDTVPADVEQVEDDNIANRFPGRQTLLRKAINHHRAQSY